MTPPTKTPTTPPTTRPNPKTEVKFCTNQPMMSARGEQAKHRYRMFHGKSGKRWLVADCPNAGDHVNVEGGADSKGFGGAFLAFDLVGGQTVHLQGPWLTTPDACLSDTGKDFRACCMTKGVIAFERDMLPGYWYSFRDIIHEDEVPVIGYFHRIIHEAQEMADMYERRVYYAYVSKGGGSSHYCDPSMKKAT